MPAQPRVDPLFAVVDADLTLQSALGFRSSGSAGLAFRQAPGTAQQDVVREIVALLDADDDAPVAVNADQQGYVWLVTKQPDAGLLAADLHAAQLVLGEHGFAEGVLCAVFPYADKSDRAVGLVYQPKRGTFYPFAPTRAPQRDAVLEEQVFDLLVAEVPMERDRSRWAPLWGIPGLVD